MGLWSWCWQVLGICCSPKGNRFWPLEGTIYINHSIANEFEELKGLLGKICYIRRFIPGLAALTSAFAPLFKKNVKYEWTNDDQAAYEKIQALILKLPTMQLPRPGKPLLVYLAAMSNAIGALLAQENEEDEEKPVYYVSRQLHDAEKCYPSAERACLALVYASQ